MIFAIYLGDFIKRVVDFLGIDQPIHAELWMTQHLLLEYRTQSRITHHHRVFVFRIHLHPIA